MPAPGGPIYDEAYFRETFGRDQIRRGSVAWWSIRFYAHLAARRLRRSRGRRVLDIGCAHGWLLSRLEREFETWGIDLSEYAVSRSREVAPRSRIYRGDIAGGLPPEVAGVPFDLIVARYVLEHLADPLPLLRAMTAALAPGGAVLLSVPNTASPGLRLKGKRWFGYQDPTHVSLWEPDRWLREAENAGLEIENRFSDGLWDVPYVSWIPAGLQYLVFSIPAGVEVLLTRPILPVSWGENLILIAGRGSSPAVARRV